MPMTLLRCFSLAGMLAVGTAYRMRVGDDLELPDNEPLVEQDSNATSEMDADVARYQREQHLEHARALAAAPVNDDEVYLLSEPSAEGIAAWAHQKTGSTSMLVSYEGERKGSDASQWDFDVSGNVAGEDTSGAAASDQIQWSVRYRHTAVGKVGFGSHFYQKFAILPKGSTDKWDSLYTVKLIHAGFYGSLEWAITKGYCKQRLGGLASSCNEGASLNPLYYIHCSPIDAMDDRHFPNKHTPGIVTRDNIPYYKPGTPFSCMVADTRLSGLGKKIRFHGATVKDAPEVPEFQEYQPSMWIELKNGQLELEVTNHAASFDAGLLRVVATAIKPAYDLGVH